MICSQLLAYVTGAVNRELLSRNEYLAAENRILKAKIKGRLLLSWRPQPDTILGWYRVANAEDFGAIKLPQGLGST